MLICDQLHDGPCFWPDGEPAAEHVVARPESFEPAPRTPIPTAEPEPAMDGDA
jgi:hypothetical protein